MGAGLASAAAVMYLLAASAVAPKLGPAGRPTLALVALALHAAALLQTLVHEGQLTVGVSEALSLFAWQAAVLLWILCLTQQLQGLTLAVYPLAAIAALTAGLVPSSVTGIPLVEWKLQLHVALSLFAAGFLSLAAVQASESALQDVGQLDGGSQVSPSSTTPFPQIGAQSRSVRKEQPTGQQPSPAAHARFRDTAQRLVQL